jgi:hypothetical protein
MSLPSSLSSQNIDAIGPVIKQQYSLCKISVYAVHHPIKHQIKPLTFTCITFFVARLSITVKWLLMRVHFFNVSQQQAIPSDDLLQFLLNIALHKPVQPVLHPFQSRFKNLFLSKQHHNWWYGLPHTSYACTSEPKAMITECNMKMYGVLFRWDIPVVL